MKAKAGVIAGILALFGIGGVLWARKAVAAENCPAGYHWDEDTQTCLPDEVLPVTCGEGYHWDEGAQICILDEVVPITCEKGYHWDEDEQACVLDEPTVRLCNEGYHWDANVQACVPNEIIPVGTEFSNFTVHYPDQVAPGQDFVVTLYFTYKGEGGIFDVGIYLYLGYGYVSSQSINLPSSAGLAGWATDIFFSGGPLSALPSGTMIDAFRFIKKPGVPFSPNAAGQMEITSIDSGAIKVV